MTIRSAVFATALAVGAALGLTAGALPAMPVTASVIDATETGTLTVHKFEQPVLAGGAGDGTQVPSALISGLTPLPGVTFQVQQVQGIDLTANTGWAQLDALVASFDPLNPGGWPAAPYTLGGAVSQSTGPSGQAPFPGLDLGLYLVTETGPATIDGKAVTRSLPFLVTVPITDPDARDAWLYDVHVYPKNVLSAVSKTVADANSYVAEDGVVFTIAGSIPGGHVTSKYQLVDALDPAFAFDSARVFIGSAETTEYTLDATGGVVTVTLTETGRAAALAAVQLNPAATVRAELTVTMLEPGVHDNQAQVIWAPGFETVPGWQPGDPDPQLPDTVLDSTIVETRWGVLEVLKHGTTTATVLPGAVFELYGGTSDDFDEATLPRIGGETRFSTGPGGVLTIEGLRYSDFAGNAAVASGDAGFNHYWLKEVTAPAGYTLLAEPVPFTITAPTMQLAIQNVTAPGDDIPLTGLAIGGAALLGLALLGAGALALARPRRRTITG